MPALSIVSLSLSLSHFVAYVCFYDYGRVFNVTNVKKVRMGIKIFTLQEMYLIRMDCIFIAITYLMNIYT